MLSCFYKIEEDKILLNEDIINLTMSFLYGCPSCGICTIIEKEKEHRHITYDETYIYVNRTYHKCNFKVECSSCYRNWRRSNGLLLYQRIKRKILLQYIRLSDRFFYFIIRFL